MAIKKPIVVAKAMKKTMPMMDKEPKGKKCPTCGKC